MDDDEKRKIEKILMFFLSPEKRLILELCHRVDGDKECWVPTTKKVKNLHFKCILYFVIYIVWYIIVVSDTVLVIKYL